MIQISQTNEEFSEATWSGQFPIPALGDRVDIFINGIGWGEVTGYFEEEGWLGVEVLLDVLWTGVESRPARVHVFGAELRQGEDPGAPVFNAEAQRAVAEVASRFRNYRDRIETAWRNGDYNGECIPMEHAGRLQLIRNSEAGREFLYRTTRPMLLEHKHRARLERLARTVELAV